jgi:hypothetical protein
LGEEHREDPDRLCELDGHLAQHLLRRSDFAREGVPVRSQTDRERSK